MLEGIFANGKKKRSGLISLVCFFLLLNFAHGQDKKFFTDYSLIHTKMGERRIGNILERNKEGVSFQDLYGNTSMIQKREIKRIYPSGQKLIMRNDGKFAFINYMGMDVRFLLTGYGNQFYIDYCFNFMDNFRIGLLVGDHTENTDFIAYPMTGFSFRYTIPAKATRPFVALSYAYNLRDENAADQSEIDIVNLGCGLDLLNRKKVKFDASFGVSARRRNSFDRTFDRAGNPVEFERNTVGISPYAEIGVKFRLTSFDW